MNDQERARLNYQASPGFIKVLGDVVGKAKQAAPVVNNFIKSAGELITDKDLRKQGAVRAFQGIASGVQQQAGNISKFPGNVKGGVKGIVAKIAEKQERARENQLIRQSKQLQDELVDVQLGMCVIFDQQQCVRSRLWMALLDNPELTIPLQKAHYSTIESTDTPASPDQPEKLEKAEANPAQDTQPNTNQDTQQTATDPPQHPPEHTQTNDPEHTADEPALDDAAADYPGQESPSPTLVSTTRQSDTAHESRPLLTLDDDAAQDSSSGVARREEYVKQLQQYYATKDPHTVSQLPDVSPFAKQPVGGAKSLGVDSNGGTSAAGSLSADWEVVGDGKVFGMKDPRTKLMMRSESARALLMDNAVDAILVAMNQVPWPVPADVHPESRYATLTQISIGQEDVDDIISRDIHRTFPKHPQFALQQTQKELGNILKAYSLHDLEVGYCQGMGFVAGMLLFYLPQEPAFRVFCSLMSEDGPNLRRLYLPGLTELKILLGMFEWLMQTRMPDLFDHLRSTGVPSVLYASQWFLSCFSCPFPVQLGSRLVDIMLVQKSDEVLLRMALAVMMESAQDLIGKRDFEDVVAYLKVEPPLWDQQRHRSAVEFALNMELTKTELKEAYAQANEQLQRAASRGTMRRPDPSQEGADQANDINNTEGHPQPAQSTTTNTPQDPQLTQTSSLPDADSVLQQQDEQMDADALSMYATLDAVMAGGDSIAALDAFERTLERSTLRGGASWGAGATLARGTTAKLGVIYDMEDEEEGEEGENKRTVSL